MEKRSTMSCLGHLFVTTFLHNFAVFMVVPSITDVTMSALCPGQDECSLAIYLTGFQQAIMGLGSIVTMPLVGNLSDRYGRKALLTIPMVLTILPLGTLACGRTKGFFYVYYVLKTLTASVAEGSVHCLALAYAADNVGDARRASIFGYLSGIGSCAFVCGTLSARFLSTASTFLVAVSMAIASTVYMRVFLPDSVMDDEITVPILSEENVDVTLPAMVPVTKKDMFQTMPSIEDVASFLNGSLTLLQAAIVSFFGSLADVGLHASLMYYLKAKFHFNKDQFADLMVIAGAAGALSQLLFMPILVPALGEERLLCVGLFFSCMHIFLFSIAWSSWVPYAASLFSVLFIFAQPCVRSIVSKQVGPFEQGKAQGIISGIGSLANVISPLVFSPLTALFLSEKAPFNFPGFSIMCVGFASMIAFIQSIMIKNGSRRTSDQGDGTMAA